MPLGSRKQIGLRIGFGRYLTFFNKKRVEILWKAYLPSSKASFLGEREVLLLLEAAEC